MKRTGRLFNLLGTSHYSERVFIECRHNLELNKELTKRIHSFSERIVRRKTKEIKNLLSINYNIEYFPVIVDNRIICYRIYCTVFWDKVNTLWDIIKSKPYN